jgi:hypothetical protein
VHDPWSLDELPERLSYHQSRSGTAITLLMALTFQLGVGLSRLPTRLSNISKVHRKPKPLYPPKGASALRRGSLEIIMRPVNG